MSESSTHRDFDPAYEIDTDIPPREVWEHDRDSVYYFDTVVKRVLETVLDGARGRVLDVGSGDGHQLLALLRAEQDGVSLYGIDLSRVLVARSRGAFVDEPSPPAIVWGTAEQMPFIDGSFNRIVCQGSLDHFGDASSFFADASRALAPGGRLIVALHNFDSASCRISRALYGLRGLMRVPRADPTGGDRPYWRIPPNHTFKGNTRVLRELGSRDLKLEQMYGVSMFWLLPIWRRALKLVPRRVAFLILRLADVVARRAPSMADMIISVWRRKDDG